MRPCSPGGRPVPSEDRLVTVVAGKPAGQRPATSATTGTAPRRRAGAAARRPRPSTSSTTARAGLRQPEDVRAPPPPRASASTDGSRSHRAPPPYAGTCELSHGRPLQRHRLAHRPPAAARVAGLAVRRGQPPPARQSSGAASTSARRCAKTPSASAFSSRPLGQPRDVRAGRTAGRPRPRAASPAARWRRRAAPRRRRAATPTTTSSSTPTPTPTCTGSPVREQRGRR